MSVNIIMCPFCESQSFVFPLNGIKKFLCHSCQRYSNLDFISKFFKNSSKNKKNIEFDYSALLNAANQINTLPEDHKASIFVRNRAIDNSELYYVENLKQFLRGTKYENTDDEFSKIIIPLKNKTGLFGIQARKIDSLDKGPKYTTFKFIDVPTIYGVDKVDYGKPIVVVEGPIDSMFIDNCIAVTGSGFAKIEEEGDYIYCLDNEPRNKAIVNIMDKLIKEDKKVVIWPDKIKEKDVNNMVLKGIDANAIIYENVYSGARALIKFSNWKKV